MTVNTGLRCSPGYPHDLKYIKPKGRNLNDMTHILGAAWLLLEEPFFKPAWLIFMTKYEKGWIFKACQVKLNDTNIEPSYTFFTWKITRSWPSLHSRTVLWWSLRNISENVIVLASCFAVKIFGACSYRGQGHCGKWSGNVQLLRQGRKHTPYLKFALLLKSYTISTSWKILSISQSVSWSMRKIFNP